MIYKWCNILPASLHNKIKTERTDSQQIWGTVRHNADKLAKEQGLSYTVDRVSDPPTQLSAVYAKPRCRTKLGERGFSHAGPTAWNSLPHHLHQISDTGLFKRRLKTELFHRAYIASSCLTVLLYMSGKPRNCCVAYILIAISKLFVPDNTTTLCYRPACCNCSIHQCRCTYTIMTHMNDK